ncbi:MAG: hypothetical protein V3V31_13290 [Methylococcales bacterium]
MTKIHSSRYRVSSDHPSLVGHFPGDPIVPGVVLLNHVQSILLNWQPDYRIVGLQQAKFLAPLRPNQECRVTLTEKPVNKVKFECTVGNERVATGLIHVEKRQ